MQVLPTAGSQSVQPQEQRPRFAAPPIPVPGVPDLPDIDVEPPEVPEPVSKGATVGKYVVGTPLWLYKHLGIVGGGALKHTLNNLGGLGIPGATWNEQEAYRTRYTPEQRFAGTLGDVATIPLAALLVKVWHDHGWAVPTIKYVPPQALRGAMALGLAAGVVSGVRRTVDDVRDEGNFGNLAGSAALLGTAFATRKLPGTAGKLLILGLTVGAGFGGHALGEKLGAGKGHIGEERPLPAWMKLEGAPPLAFARGLFNHVAEGGPLTQGATFGWTWKRQEAMRDHYTTPELVGGMIGDMLVVPLAVTAGLIGAGYVLQRPESQRLQNTVVGRTMLEWSIMARMLGKFKSPNFLIKTNQLKVEDSIERTTQIERNRLGGRFQLSWLERLLPRAIRYDGKYPQALYLGSALIAAYTLRGAYNGVHGDNPRMNKWERTGLSAALTAGTAAAVWKYAPLMRNLEREIAEKGMPASNFKLVRPAISLLAGSALAATVFSVFDPAASFMDGADYLREREGAPKLNWETTVMAGTGATAGGLLGHHAARLMLFNGRWTAAMTAGAGIAGGFAGASFAPLLNGFTD